MPEGYHWLHKKGEQSINKNILDYDADRRNGYSIYEDGRDLIDVLPEPVIVTDNTVVQEFNSKGEPKQYTCTKCGRVFNHHLPLASHKRLCK